MNTSTSYTDRSTSAPGDEAQYLSFSLAGEDYAVEILRVQEIRGMCPITPLPQSPRHVSGVMNLRGAIVPVIDLRVALGLEPAEHGKYSVIIVLSVSGRTVGIVVDSVSDVLAFGAGAVEKEPDLGSRVDVSLVSGIARTQDRFVILLDIERATGSLGGM